MKLIFFALLIIFALQSCEKEEWCREQDFLGDWYVETQYQSVHFYESDDEYTFNSDSIGSGAYECFDQNVDSISHHSDFGYVTLYFSDRSETFAIEFITTSFTSQGILLINQKTIKLYK